jgi:hypothetical protein
MRVFNPFTYACPERAILALCVCVFVSFLIGAIVFLNFVRFGHQEHNHIVSVTPTPDRKLQAIVFLRHEIWGSNSIHVAVLSSRANIQNVQDGNVFRDYSNNWADVAWLDGHTLQISHPKSASCFALNNFIAFDRGIDIEEKILSKQ